MLAACLAKYQAYLQMQVDDIYRSNTNNSTSNTINKSSTSNTSKTS